MLNEIRNFCVTAECLNFTTAAKFLYIEQPALSKQISRLEEELGVKLFQRTTRRVSLTPAGESFLKQCRAFISACDTLPKNFPRNSTSGNARGLTLGLGETVDSGSLMEALGAFFADHEDVGLSFVHMQDEKLPTLLLSEEADLIYTFRTVIQEDARYDYIPIRKARMRVLLWKGHPLADREEIHLRDLKDEWFIMNSASPPMLTSMLHSMCEANGFFPKISAKVDSPQMSIMMTCARQGITLTTFAAPDLTCSPNVVCKNIAPSDLIFDAMENDLVLAWRKDTYQGSELIRQFVESVRSGVETAT